jgi:hypothetical protein
MAEPVSESLQKKLSSRLSFYEDLGIPLFCRDRGGVAVPEIEQRLELPATTPFSIPAPQKEDPLPKPAGKAVLQKTASVVTPVIPKIVSLPLAAGPSLFESMDKIANDTLNWFLLAKARAPMKTHKDCPSSGALENC